MAKIHKSSAIILDSKKPVVIDRPELGRGLRESMLAGGAAFKIKTQCEPSKDRPENRSRLQEEQLKIQCEAMRLKAETLIQDAQEEAAKILEQARQEAIDIKSQAFSQGKAEAEKDIRRDIKQHIQKIDQKLKSIATRLNQDQQQVLDELEPQILRLSLAIAEKIIGTELERQEKTYRKLVQNIIDKLRPDEPITVYVNEKDYWHSLASQNVKESLKQNHIQVVRDEKLPRGSCQVEGSFGTLYAGVKQQIDEIRRQWQLDD